MSEAASEPGSLGLPATRAGALSHQSVGRRSALAGVASFVACRALRAEEADEAARDEHAAPALPGGDGAAEGRPQPVPVGHDGVVIEDGTSGGDGAPQGAPAEVVEREA